MHRWRVFFARAWGFLHKRRLDDQLQEELQAHLDQLTEENIRSGMSGEDARAAAVREFGGVEQTKEIYRQQRGLPFLDVALQDLRFAFRGLVKRPGFTIAAVLTLMLGIGATTAVFSVVDRILFRSLPYPHDDRLVSFGLLAPIERDEFTLGAGYIDFRKEPGPFEAITSMAPGTTDCDITEQNPVRLNCAQVEQTFLPTFGTEPLLGRNFTAEEDLKDAPLVAILSYGLWKSRFGGNPDVLRKTVSLDGKTAQIIGVLPARFEMPTLRPADILVPLALDEAQQRKSAPGAVLRTFARLKPGVDVRQAIAALQPWFELAVSGAPPQFRKEIHLSVRTLRERQTSDARLASWILLGSVFAVLLVACTNVANLLLARATVRERELAVRAALGASRGRLARQSLTESLLLGLLGGAAGCGLAIILIRVFVSIAPEGIPRLQQAGLDERVGAFALVVTLAAALIFGVAPALYRPSSEIMMGKGQIGARRGGSSRQILVVAEIAISIVLLASAGPLMRSLWKLQNAPTGMETENVLTEQISLGSYNYKEAAQQFAFFTDLEARLKRFPGITSVALSDSIPPAGQMRSTILAAVEVAGKPALAEGTGGPVGWRAVTPDYFRALAIPIIAGRGFREEDRLPAENPIILGDTLARELFPGERAVGKELRLFKTPDGPWRTVVGVAANVKNDGLATNGDPEFYLPWKNDPLINLRAGYVIVRTRMNPKSVASWMRSETGSLDATLPVTIEAMSQRVGKLTERPRFNAMLLCLFAGVAVLLAAVGIYGVIGFLVVERTREIGVRLALGATPQSILKMVMSSVARCTIVGAMLGLLGAWFCTRLLESLLFEVRAHDPVMFGLAILALVAVALCAAWVPARRAMHVDPLIALRYE
jgi:putative ABC transport system permease protein